MTKEKLIYLAVAVVSGVFFILYRDMLALVLFLVILAIPILLFILTVLMRLGIRIRVEADRTVCSNEETATISLVIANYSLLPVSQITVFANYKNAFFKHHDVGEFQFFAPPLSKNRYEIEVRSRHAGKVEVFFKKARVLDYFGVFSLPIKIKKRLTVSFLPRVHSVEPTLRKNTYTASETNLYSQYKPGDDPAEVFAVREYVDGDKLSRIHWKLSSKQDCYMVKDYSLPINEAVLILPELVFDEGDEANLDLIDAVLEIAFSLSHTLVERKTLHAIGYYNVEADKVCVQKIGDLDDLYSVFGEIFNTSAYYNKPVLANMDPELQQNMSHVVYISANVTAERCNALSADKSEALLYTLINVVDENTVCGEIGDEDLNCISVKKSGIVSCLNDAVL